MPPEIIPLRIGHCRAAERLSRRDAGWRPIAFPAGAVLIRHPGEGDILFDTGYGQAFFDATRPLPERIYRWLTPVRLLPDETLPARLGQYRAKPGLVILSHLHADHCAGLFDLAQIPPLLTSRAAWAHLTPGTRIATLRRGCPDGLRRRLQNLTPCFIEDLPALAPPEGFADLGPFHDIAGDGTLLAVPLPGHGHGQFGLFLPRTTTGPAFLIADAAWSRAALRAHMPPPDFTLKRLGDVQAYHRSFTALAALMRARPDITFFPAHCPEAFA